MKVFELLTFNRELLRKIHEAGIRPDDWKYTVLYADYRQMKDRGEKVTYIVSVLAVRYSVSIRQVYNLIGRFGEEIDCTADAVE